MLSSKDLISGCTLTFKGNAALQISGARTRRGLAIRSEITYIMVRN